MLEAAVEHRVVGPPGCGKTTYLTRQVARAVDKFGQDKVLITSLTRAAAQEVAGRGLDLPRRAIGTLHAHAYRALDRPALAETSEGLKAWNEWLDTEGRLGAWKIDPGAGGDLDWAPAEQKARRKGEGLLSMMQTYRARRAPRELWKPSVVRFAEAWTEWKVASGRSDFTDLIERALRTTAAAPGEPSVIMLDEAQDFSRLELDLARKWAAAAEQIVIVGDAWQALFSWRGADPEAMMKGEAASEHVLEQSYRVPAAVHEYAVDWLNRGPQPLTVEYRPRLADPRNPSKGPAPGALEWCGHGWKEPQGVIARILDDLDEGLSVMVLASCGYMLIPLIAGLRHRGVPFWNPYRCSPPGEPILTSEGWVPIEKLDPARHRLAGFKANTNALTWGPHWGTNGSSRASGPRVEGERRGFEFSVERQSYRGTMLTIRTGRSRTRVTPNHRVRVRFAEPFYGASVVYLMRRGDWWRIGVSTPRRGGDGRRDGSRDLRDRLNREGADCAWILGAYPTLREARRAEIIFQTESGITGTVFREQGTKRYFEQADLNKIHDFLMPESGRRARGLLKRLGLLEEHPLYRRDGKRRRQHAVAAFETVAANLLPDYMLFPAIPEEFASAACNRAAPDWLPFTVEREHYVGEVLSLHVPGVEHYVSGGGVVHNSNHGGWNPLRGANRLLAYLRPDPDTWAHEARSWSWEDLRLWVDVMEAKGRLAKGAKKKVAEAAREAAEKGNEEEPVEVARVAQLFATLEIADQATDLDADWWAASLLSDAKKRMAYPLAVHRERGGRALRDEPRLITGTVHSVKGGVADSVYLWPDISNAGWISSWENPAHRAPLYRLFYVGMTRAREKLTICAASGSQFVTLPKP